jgi:rhodanese-related sulfurtransferase
MKKLSNVVIAFIFGLFIFNFFIKNIAEADVKESYARFLSGKAIFIDVREEDEVKQGMVKGAIWHPLSRLEKDKALEIKKIKDEAHNKEIYLYCRSGNRSGKVKGYLEEAGIKSVNMGGFNNLVNEHIPTQQGPQ